MALQITCIFFLLKGEVESWEGSGKLKKSLLRDLTKYDKMIDYTYYRDPFKVNLNCPYITVYSCLFLTLHRTQLAL